MPEENVKIILLGPSGSGKSNIANFLSGTRDNPTEHYKETNPLRIFEVVLEGLNVGGRRHIGRGTKCTVELWDVGGSTKFQNCWPAIWKGAHGIVFVFNPEVPNQEKELELWYKSFMVPAEVPPEHCLAFAHHSSPPQESFGGGRSIPKLPSVLSKVRVLETSLDFQSDNFKEAFDKLVEGILTAQREKEENRLLQDDGMSGPLLAGANQ